MTGIWNPEITYTWNPEGGNPESIGLESRIQKAGKALILNPDGVEFRDYRTPTPLRTLLHCATVHLR